MPYPRNDPENKHDIVSPSTISISSGKLQPLFDSTPKIIQQIKDKDFKLKKLALKVYTYNDAPSTPQILSRALYFAGFCNLSAICKKSSFDYDSFAPLDGMTLCHMAVKRADKASLAQHDLDNSNKFTFLCSNLRSNGIVALIQCPKTNRAGFFIPMNEMEDGSNFAAYCYIGEVDAVEKMLLTVENDSSGGVGGDSGDSGGVENVETSDEPVWKPDDDDDDDDDNHGTINGGHFSNDNDDANDMWQPPGNSSNDNNDGTGGDDSNIWKPPGETDNNDSNTLWQPPGSNTENNDESNLWDQSGNATESNLWEQQQPEEPTSSNGNDVNMTSQESKFHADSGAAAADKFYSELTRSLGTRADSILFHMRNFNGWVKATQIAELDPHTMLEGSKNGKKRKRTRHPLRILDLACGKGGDLGMHIKDSFFYS